MKTAGKRTLSIEEWAALASAPGSPLPPVWIHVVSESMLPLIRPFREQLLLASVRQDELKVGDIVLFPAKCRSGNYCLHRLYKIEGEQVQTLGDFCYQPDRMIPKKNILGKVLLIRRGKHQIDCETRFWRAAAKGWMILLPFRPLFLFVYHVYRKVKRLFL